MKRILLLFKVAIMGLILSYSIKINSQVLNPIADASIQSFNDAFLTRLDGQTYYKSSLNNTTHDGTWTLAIDIFTMQDTYERRSKESDKVLINELCTSFLKFNPTPYNWDGWNDDLAWMGLGLARGYQITKTPSFLTAAEHSFNLAYDRGWNTEFNNGGIWEQQPNMTPENGGINKEALSNNPNGKLACILYESTNNIDYKNKAIKIYNWSRKNIFNPKNGQVYANIDRSDYANTDTAVYNQGSFIDFAAHLYKITGDPLYLRDAQLAATYVIENMTNNGIISNSADYLNTWADEYARGLGHLCMWNPELWNKYYPFMKANSDSAWNNRRTDLNITDNAWIQATSLKADPVPTVHASAVAMHQYTPTVQPIPGTIAAINYNFKNESFVTIPGANVLSTIKQDDWVQYIVNVPATANYTVVLSAASAGLSKVEIQQNNIMLTTVEIPSTGNDQTYANVSASVRLTSGIQSFKLKGITGNFNLNNLIFQSCQTIKAGLSVNGGAAQEITEVTVLNGDNVAINPSLTGGFWSWTGPNNFSAATGPITINAIDETKTGVYTAKYTATDGCISIQNFLISLNSCTPTTVVPLVSVNNETPQNLNAVTVEAGSYVVISSNTTDGSWSWTSPNGFTSNDQKIAFLTIGYKNQGTYTATYTNAVGCKSTMTVSLTLTGADPCSAPIKPYININDVKWESIAYASLGAGDKFTVGPQAQGNGTWNWTGPNNFTSQSREFTITNFSAEKAGVYAATYTNTAGCVSVLNYNIGWSGNCSQTAAVVPVIMVDNQIWTNNDNVTVASGKNVSITFPQTGGKWSWSGPNNFTASTSTVVMEKVLFWKKGNYVIKYIDDNFCISTHTINIDVVGDDYCGNPIIPYYIVNNVKWEMGTSVEVKEGDRFQAGPQPNENGRWLWEGPNGFRAESREFTIPNVQKNQEGIYHATRTNNLGCLSFIEIELKIKSNLGLKDYETSQITYFPNPTKDYLTITKVPDNEAISIFDVNGKEVFKKHSGINSNGDVVLDVSKLSFGIYIVKVGKLKTFKVAKK